MYHASITNAWEHGVWTSNFDKVRDHVKNRKQRIKKENYMEKVDGKFTPYAIVEHYGKIENKLFLKCKLLIWREVSMCCSPPSFLFFVFNIRYT